MKYRFEQYRIMWVLVLFDLPTETKKQRRDAAKFRKNLQGDGFNMFQYSIYTRHCASMENATVHKKRVQNFLPEYGHVVIFTLTDKQFSDIMVFHARAPITPNEEGYQLELF